MAHRRKAKAFLRAGSRRSAPALSLRRSAERSRPRKATPSRSAMSMPTFHINRAGKNLGAARRRKLEAAKSQLRRLIGRE
jgi:hypothetical protein